MGSNWSGWSDDQARAALGATSGEHLAAADGLHPCAETVGAFALDDRRLVSTFHDSDSGIWRLVFVQALKNRPARSCCGEKPCIRTVFGVGCQSLSAVLALCAPTRRFCG